MTDRELEARRKIIASINNIGQYGPGWKTWRGEATPTTAAETLSPTDARNLEIQRMGGVPNIGEGLSGHKRGSRALRGKSKGPRAR